MATSSSTKKAAKLAQRGGRASVRFQGGTLFPMIVAVILVVGMVLVIYARQSRPVEANPTTEDHWHASYGFYLCDPETGKMEWKQLAGDLLTSPEYVGVHSHDDSLIHWHALTSAGTGDNATLGVFLEAYGVELDADELRIPGASLGQAEDVVYNEDDTKCGDEDGQLRVQVWNNFTDTSPAGTHTADMNDIRVDQDAMVFTIAFAPADTEIPMPENSQQLPELGAIDDDSTGQTPTLGGTTPGATAPAGTQPATGSSTPSGSSAPSGEPSATTAPAGGGAPPTEAPATTSG